MPALPPDVLARILSHAVDDASPAPSRALLLRAARTSRTFAKVALPLLWRRFSRLTSPEHAHVWVLSRWSKSVGTQGVERLEIAFPSAAFDRPRPRRVYGSDGGEGSGEEEVELPSELINALDRCRNTLKHLDLELSAGVPLWVVQRTRALESLTLRCAEGHVPVILPHWRLSLPVPPIVLLRSHVPASVLRLLATARNFRLSALDVLVCGPANPLSFDPDAGADDWDDDDSPAATNDAGDFAANVTALLPLLRRAAPTLQRLTLRTEALARLPDAEMRAELVRVLDEDVLLRTLPAMGALRTLRVFGTDDCGPEILEEAEELLPEGLERLELFGEREWEARVARDVRRVVEASQDWMEGLKTVVLSKALEAKVPAEVKERARVGGVELLYKNPVDRYVLPPRYW